MNIPLPLLTRSPTPPNPTVTSSLIENNAEPTVPVHEILHLLRGRRVDADAGRRGVRGDVCVLDEVDEDAALHVESDGGGGKVTCVGDNEGEVGLRGGVSGWRLGDW
jgi:hypothetical protein